MKSNLKAFTLIEIMVWILIFTFVMLAWFQALTSVNYWKIKLIEDTSITKEAFFFSEKLFQEIKSGWTLDYEEYFNRKISWLWVSSWHYSTDTWYWNFWQNWIVWTSTYGNWFYYCRSTLASMWTNWCYNTLYNTTTASLWTSRQRFWEYAFQFLDYNSNHDADVWDEDLNWNLRWDDDDENLWEWPDAFAASTNIKELYLISWDKKSRVYFRWDWSVDPKKPSTAPCTVATFWTGCLGTVEFLKLDWKDWWVNHNKSWTWAFDWIIDTWVVDPDLTWGAEVIAWSNSNNYRQPMFPDTLSVKDFKVYAYPNADRNNAWKDNSADKNINPYVKINMVLTPSRKKRWSMKWTVPDIKIATTINLSDYFSK